MKEKIKIKTLILGIVIGGIIFGSIGVGAATYFSAKDIAFTPTNAEWNVTNVEEATNSLYTDLTGGKELIANAITEKGINTSGSDTFETMAANIAEIVGESNDSVILESVDYGTKCGLQTGTTSTYVVWATVTIKIKVNGKTKTYNYTQQVGGNCVNTGTKTNNPNVSILP